MLKQLARFPVVVDLHDSLTLLYSRLLNMEEQLLRKFMLYLDRRGIANREKSST